MDLNVSLSREAVCTVGQVIDRFQNIFKKKKMTPHPKLNLHYETVLSFFFFLEGCWKNETEKLTALWSVRCSWRGDCSHLNEY